MSRSRDNQAVNTYLLALKLTRAHNKYFLGFGPSNPKNDLITDLDFIKGLRQAWQDTAFSGSSYPPILSCLFSKLQPAC